MEVHQSPSHFAHSQQQTIPIQRKWKKGDRVRILTGKHAGKTAQYIFGVEDGDSIVQMEEGGQMIIVPTKNLQTEDPTADVLKRKRADVEQEESSFKSSFHIPRKDSREVNLPPISSLNAGAAGAAPVLHHAPTSSPMSPPHTEAGGQQTFHPPAHMQPQHHASHSHHSPLSQLPLPWKQFLSTFLHNKSSDHMH